MCECVCVFVCMCFFRKLRFSTGIVYFKNEKYHLTLAAAVYFDLPN